MNIDPKVRLVSPAPNAHGAYLVYALSDPRQPAVPRYIGRSSIGISGARRHLRMAHRGTWGPLYTWIRALAREGIGYRIAVLEEPPADRLVERQNWWVHLHHRTILNLGDVLNGADKLAAKRIRNGFSVGETRAFYIAPDRRRRAAGHTVLKPT